MRVCQCDICELSKECLQKLIDDREYHICSECWDELMARLKGKGRPGKAPRVILTPPDRPQEPELPPAPEKPPKIWYSTRS